MFENANSNLMKLNEICKSIKFPIKLLQIPHFLSKMKFSSATSRGNPFYKMISFNKFHVILLQITDYAKHDGTKLIHWSFYLSFYALSFCHHPLFHFAVFLSCLWKRSRTWQNILHIKNDIIMVFFGIKIVLLWVHVRKFNRYCVEGRKSERAK